MSSVRLPWLWLWVSCLQVPLAAQVVPDLGECTVGVACGKATADGRALLWKNRDGRDADNVVLALADGRLPYFALCNAGKSDAAWGGANIAGFCIVNGVARDLAEGASKGPDNGEFIKLALQQCADVAQFEELLKQTNTSGRRTRANFGVIDAVGGAAFFEAGHTSYQRFDAATTANGWLVRTNFATTAGGERGRERFVRAEQLLGTPPAKPLTTRFLLQQFVRDLQAPPSAQAGAKGRLDTRETIHRQDTVAALVFAGVKQGEDRQLTTMWALLGQPLFAMAVPLWPAAGAVPRELSGDPRSVLCTTSRRLAGPFYTAAEGAAGPDDAPGDGELAGPLRWLRTDTMPIVRRAILFGEAEILARTDEMLERWRKAGSAPSAAAQRAFTEAMARLALERVRDLADEHAPEPAVQAPGAGK